MCTICELFYQAIASLESDCSLPFRKCDPLWQFFTQKWDQRCFQPVRRDRISWGVLALNQHFRSASGGSAVTT